MNRNRNAEVAASTYSTLQLKRAFWAGHDAAVAGESYRACPYRELGGPVARVTGVKAYRNAWMNGWSHGREQTPAPKIDGVDR